MIQRFYEDCLVLFMQIIYAGTAVWGFINEPIIDLIHRLPDTFFSSILEWITSAFNDLSILQFGLGSGLGLFIGISILKFIKVI